MKIHSYAKSTAVGKIKKALSQKKTPLMAFLDLDSTFYDPNSNKTDRARKLLEKKGYAVVFNTSRTEELVMSEKERKASHYFDRPAPHLDKIKLNLQKNKKTVYYYTDPKKIEPKGVLDPDIIIGSTGTAIWIKQIKGGYLPDQQYTESFETTSLKWRNSTLKLLKSLKKSHEFNISALEEIENYEKNKTNVAPPDFRIQIFFTSQSDLKSFSEKTIKIRNLNLRLIEDSKPSHGKYVLYLTPLKASKIHAQENVISQLLKILHIKRDDIKIFVAGDSWPDINLNLNRYPKNETFLLVGGSRLYKNLSKSNLKNKINFIFGDERYPKKRGVDSIIAFLNEF